MDERFLRCARIARGLGGGFLRDGRIGEHWTDGPRRGVLAGAKWGLAAAQWPTVDFEHLTEMQFEVLTHRHFWAPLRCDALYPGVDLMVFDFGIERGIAESARMLRHALGVRGSASVDEELVREARTRCPADLVEDLAEQQQRALEEDERFPLFGLGWTRRLFLREQEAQRQAREAPPCG